MARIGFLQGHAFVAQVSRPEHEGIITINSACGRGSSGWGKLSG
jgi:hypothetical protein